MRLRLTFEQSADKDYTRTGRLSHDFWRRSAESEGRTYIVVNGRGQSYWHIKKLTKLSPSKWDVETTRGLFHIIGGRQAGGLPTDWWVWGGERHQFPQFEGDVERTVPHFASPGIHCNSLVECLKLIEGM